MRTGFFITFFHRQLHHKRRGAIPANDCAHVEKLRETIRSDAKKTCHPARTAGNGGHKYGAVVDYCAKQKSVQGSHWIVRTEAAKEPKRPDGGWFFCLVVFNGRTLPLAHL